METGWISSGHGEGDDGMEKYSRIYFGLRPDGTMIWKEITYHQPRCCPKCGNTTARGFSVAFCKDCGTKMNWSETTGGVTK